MSYADEYTDSEDEFEDGSSLVKKLRAKIDELQSRNKELESENKTFHSTIRKQSLSEILAQRGYSEKIAAFVPSDLEVSEESVDQWLAEYGDAFTPAVPQANQEQHTTIAGNAAQADALRRMAAAESAAQPDLSGSGNILGRIEQATSMEELEAVLRGA